MKIEKTELAPGLQVSRIVNGLWQIADIERDGKILDPLVTARAMQHYVQAGLTSFDMADHYGSAEVIAGTFRKLYGGDQAAQFLTKWVPAPGTISREDVRTAVSRALERLQTSRIDLMQFHAWNYADPQWLDCLFWLQELKDEGLIQQLGLTNFDTAHLRIVLHSGIEVISNQVSYSLLDQRASLAMTDLCIQHNVKLLAYGTIAGGFLTEKWLRKPEPQAAQLQTWSEQKYKRFIDVAGGWNVFQQFLERINSVASKLGVSVSNVATRYILEQPALAAVIIGARLGRSEHLDENLRLFGFSLSHSAKTEIKDALSLFSLIPGDCGDEYRKPPFLTASGDLSHHLQSLPAPFPTKRGNDGRTKALSGTIWEDLAGFSRAVRKENRILVSGTTATHRNNVIGGMDPAAQVHFVIDKIEGALLSLGGRLEDVVRTRIFIKRMADWEVIARAHGERFGQIQPANTMVRADLIGDEYLVEMEAEAEVGER